MHQSTYSKLRIVLVRRVNEIEHVLFDNTNI